MGARLAALWLALALVLAFTAPAAAVGIDLDRAKGQGLIGEKADGFVGIVVLQTNSLIQAIVRRTNSKRQEFYEEIARKHGTTVDSVAVRAGELLTEREGRGYWVTDADGVWRRK